MPVAAIGIGLGTALAGGAAAGASIYGAHKQASAAQHAADIQVSAGNRALDWEQQQYGQAQDTYNAWLNGGDMARLSDLVKGSPGYGNQPQPTAPITVPPPRFAPQQTQSLNQMRSVGYGQTPGAAATGGMVTMQSPTGEVRAVQPGSVQKYLTQGARVIR